jgi:hypothetical protein
MLRCEKQLTVQALLNLFVIIIMNQKVHWRGILAQRSQMTD